MDLFQHSKNSHHNNSNNNDHNDPVNKLAKERSVISQSILKYVYICIYSIIIRCDVE